ncbi:hypothetical protein ACOMHN_009557 [Nucella lapillus]
MFLILRHLCPGHMVTLISGLPPLPYLGWGTTGLGNCGIRIGWGNIGPGELRYDILEFPLGEHRAWETSGLGNIGPGEHSYAPS